MALIRTRTLFLLFVNVVFGQTLFNNCDTKQTCDECIREIECAWCITPERSSSGKLVHCRPKDDNANWCRNGLESPQREVKIVEEEDFSNHTDNPIQIKPQRIKLTLRKGEKYDLKFQFKMTENYPVDLYYIMDLSFSMKPYKNKLAELGNKLAQAMRKLTTNFRLGFGSFIDKVELPFVSTDKTKLESPCEGCAKPYSFINDLPLTNNSDEFVRKVRAAKVSGNIDSPEGGFDAIMQAIVCKEKIQWREHARHLLVFSTDDEFHIAGDGKLAGVIEPNPAKCYTNDSEYLIYDYPSISQINDVAKVNKINIIFAIVKRWNSLASISYSKLPKLIENSHFGLLNEQDDNNVISLVIEYYKKIAEVVKMTSDASKEVDVKFSSNCKDSTIPGRCSNVHVGDILDFTATIQPRECPSDRKKIIKIHPEALEQSLIVELEIVCDCACSSKNSSSFKEKSPKCNEQGNLKCGVCECLPGRFGKYCQCDSTYSQSENVTQCIMEGSNDTCSGLGECKCGHCECKSRSNPDEEIYGQFCQCDNYSCKKHEGLICSGKGRCNCKVCECEAGYSGERCECEENTNKCIAPGSGKICSDHGNCICGKCECTRDANKYSGKYCEDCISCPAQRCEELGVCAACKIHKTGKYNEEQCEKMCNYSIIGVNKLSGDNNPMIKKCRISDNDNCIILFEYSYETEPILIHVLKEKICPEPVNIIAWIIGVIITTVIAGIIMLLIWKMFTTIHDRKEYAKFENERQKLQWQTMGNPLYREAETRFENPTFKRSISKNSS